MVILSKVRDLTFVHWRFFVACAPQNDTCNFFHFEQTCEILCLL